MASGHKIMQWKEFLKVNENKNGLITFMVTKWQKEHNRAKLLRKIVYATYQDNRVKITKEKCEMVDDLKCNHEEADTRMILHAIHSAQFNYEAIIIHSEDTDVDSLQYTMQLILVFHCFKKLLLQPE